MSVSIPPVTSVANRKGDVVLSTSDVSGLGSAATHSASEFDASGSAATVQTNLTSHTSNTSNPHNTTASQVGLGNVTNDAQLKSASNLADLSNASTARTNLSLGSASTHASTDFDASGAAATVQTNLTFVNALMIGLRYQYPYMP